MKGASKVFPGPCHECGRLVRWRSRTQTNNDKWDYIYHCFDHPITTQKYRRNYSRSKNV